MGKTVISIIDDSGIPPLPIEDGIASPIYMTAFTSDQGPEDFRLVKGKSFFDQYGDTISFAKHGQPLLQAAHSINSGATLFAKRVVAPDSYLANLAVSVDIKKVETQKTNANGDLLYTDKVTGKETTEATGTDSVANDPIMISKAKLKFSTTTVEEKSTLDEVAASIIGGATPINVGEPGVRPLFVITDNGRGVSNKKFKVSPDYTSSKSSSYTKYIFNLKIGSVEESIQFGLNPNGIDSGVNVSIEARVNTNSQQVKCFQFDDYIDNFIKSVAMITGLDPEDFANMDVLFGKTKKGESIPSIEIDVTGINLTHPYGLKLESGSNGEFEAADVTKVASYEAELAKVFNGTAGNVVFDLDNVAIDLIIDANYPAAVKRAIESLVTFRGDILYLRDLGLNLDSLDLILAADKESLKNRYCGSYHNSYDILDPYSKKQITVTIGYDFARLMVKHFIYGRNRPLAGILNEFVLDSAIEGTLNFLPVISPSVDEKEILEDARINYASYYSGRLVVESLYTSQEEYTQFSFLNNTLSVQRLIKAIRLQCPKNRYMFMDGADFKKYEDEVQNVIDLNASDFQSVVFEYVQDPIYVSNKIFYATIKVQFRNFVQNERFIITAIPS